jgi:quercetin dioxygenase-like cupin family protein
MGTGLCLEWTADYDDVRSVRAGEAIINLPDVPHVFVTVGDEPKVIVEVESPVPQAYLESGD